LRRGVRRVGSAARKSASGLCVDDGGVGAINAAAGIRSAGHQDADVARLASLRGRRPEGTDGGIERGSEIGRDPRDEPAVVIMQP
jgi:hypothetical protein